MKEVLSLRENVVNELVHWIEDNLEGDLSLDNISKRVGYSKWHLQRVFKKSTGTALGEYCRRRRLSKTALLLRLTKKDIYEIAMQYGFDSQQTFTRAFRQNFKLTPHAYRKAEYFDMDGLLPPYYYTEQQSSDCQIIKLDPLELTGSSLQTQCSVENGECFSHEFRTKSIASRLSSLPVAPAKFYGLVDYTRFSEADSNYKVSYTVALERDMNRTFTLESEKINIEAGRYASFNFNGDVSGFKDFVSKIYLKDLPEKNLLRRKGYDIEIHTPIFDKIDVEYFSCQYLVPIE